MKKLFFLFLIILIGYGIGFVVFLQKVNSYTIGADKKDALVVLTGDHDRISTGVDLLKKKRAKILFITGIQTQKDAAELFKKKARQARNQIALGRRAFDTIGNAQETAQWLARTPHVSSFYLITSDYHLPRSKVVFDSLLSGYEITPYPVPAEKTTLFLFKEYTKYILASIWHGIGMKSRAYKI